MDFFSYGVFLNLRVNELALFLKVVGLIDCKYINNDHDYKYFFYMKNVCDNGVRQSRLSVLDMCPSDGSCQ